MKMIKSTMFWIAALVLGAAMLEPGTADAAFYYFNTKITTGTNTPNVNQFAVEITSGPIGYVDFKFTNNVGVTSSITDVYFQDGTLLGIASISFSSGVDFSQNASPPNIPGGGGLTPDFKTTANFSADSNSPTAANGVNGALESLTIRFELKSGKALSDVLAALNLGISNPAAVWDAYGDDLPNAPDGLRIGIHVQAFAGGSDAFIIDDPNGPGPGGGVIPAPPGVVMAGIGGLLLVGFGGWRRRRLTVA